jgi:hypothetical protein
MLCYVMLCYVMLCYVMLCYVMLCCVNLIVFLYVTSCKCWYVPVYQTTRSHITTDRMHSHENLESQVKIFICFYKTSNIVTNSNIFMKRMYKLRLFEHFRVRSFKKWCSENRENGNVVHSKDQFDVLVLWWLIWFGVSFNLPEDGKSNFREVVWCCVLWQWAESQ